MKITAMRIFRTSLILILLAATSCNNRKYAAVNAYNDQVVKYIEQAERTVKVWNTTNFMQEYDIKKQNSITKLLAMQDSLSSMDPYDDDDTLRITALSMLDNYLHSFTIYDTIYKILSDTMYLRSDSIHVRELLKTNQNMLQMQAQTFSAEQQRFARRYNLKFDEE